MRISTPRCGRDGRPVGRDLIVPLAMAVCLALVSSSCSHDSFIVVRLYSGDAPFTDVAHVVVDVADADGNPSAKLRYDTAAKPISFDTNSSKSLSISFTPSRSGVVTVAVAVFGSSNECLGSGTAMPSPPIKKGDVSTVTVILHHTSSCGAADGGSGTDANVTFPGCDPATLGSCAANQTCFVDCSTSRGMCIAAGARGPGEPCVMNSDCMPGTQCFNYSDLPGCQPGTRVCLKFCNGDSQCSGAAAGSGGAGGARGSGGAGGAGTGGAGGRAATGGGGATGSGGSGGSGGTTPAAGAVVSACRNPVMCTPTVTTSYRTCSLACDPRGQANVGCPAGLLCFLYRDPAGGEAAPDCGCREPSRTKTDGMDCSSSVDCAPGYVCNMMGATRTCRKLCKMTSPADCSAPQTCNTLQDNSIFGVCIGAGGLDGGGTGS